MKHHYKKKSPDFGIIDFNTELCYHPRMNYVFCDVCYIKSWIVRSFLFMRGNRVLMISFHSCILARAHAHYIHVLYNNNNNNKEGCLHGIMDSSLNSVTLLRKIRMRMNLGGANGVCTHIGTKTIYTLPLVTLKNIPSFVI